MTAPKRVADGKDASGLNIPDLMHELAPFEPLFGPVGGLKKLGGKWLPERMHRILANHDFVSAVRRIANHLTVRSTEQRASALLAFLAVLATLERGSYRKAWAKLWVKGTCKSWKALKDFPKKLEGMAEELERLNASYFFAPEHCGKADFVKQNLYKLPEVVQERLYELPESMRLYAEALEVQIETVPGLTAHFFPRGPLAPLDGAFQLSRFLKVLTGRYHDKEAAELLNAAAIALGKEPHWDALKIAQARSRRKKKSKS